MAEPARTTTVQVTTGGSQGAPHNGVIGIISESPFAVVGQKLVEAAGHVGGKVVDAVFPTPPDASDMGKTLQRNIRRDTYRHERSAVEAEITATKIRANHKAVFARGGEAALLAAERKAINHEFDAGHHRRAVSGLHKVGRSVEISESARTTENHTRAYAAYLRVANHGVDLSTTQRAAVSLTKAVENDAMLASARADQAAIVEGVLDERMNAEADEDAEALTDGDDTTLAVRARANVAAILEKNALAVSEKMPASGARSNQPSGAASVEELLAKRISKLSRP